MANFGLVEGIVHSVEPTSWKGAIISVEQATFDRKGRPVTAYADIRVSPEQVEEGMHNAYRPLIGKPVFAPCSFGFYQKDGAGRAYDQIELAGLPRQLQEVKPAATPAALKPAQTA
jgi:hypothetical protein